LSKSRTLVGDRADKVNSISGDIESRSNELREREKKRQTLEKFLRKILNIFRRDEIAAEKKRNEKKQKALRKEIRASAAERRELRIEGGRVRRSLRAGSCYATRKKGNSRKCRACAMRWIT